MENKILTAEEFAWSQEEDFKTILAEANYQEVYNLMIEFAKLHVEMALESAAKSAMFSHESGKGKIHYDAYPLTNIK